MAEDRHFPKRTTFEVKVTNGLKDEFIFVKLQSELRYAEKLSSSNLNNNTENTYSKQLSSMSVADASQNAYAVSNSNEFHNEQSKSGHSKSTHSNSEASQSTTNFNASGSYGLASADVNYGSTGQKQSHSHSATENSFSNHELRKGKNASSLATQNAASNAYSDTKDDIKSKQSQSQNEISMQSSLVNKTIEPGFVRIRPNQTLAIPVVVESESQVVYLSVCISNSKNGALIPIANQLQINGQHIQITKQSNGAVGIEPIIKDNGGFRRQLEKWGIPSSLGDCMEMCGWNEPTQWDDIRTEHLQKMGFKEGHINKFHAGYKKWKTMQNWLCDDITFKSLFEKWKLPDYLCANMIDNGWDDINFWKCLTDDKYLKNVLGFKHGHVIKFKHFTKNDAHVEEFKKLKKKFEQSVKDRNENKYDYDEDYSTKKLKIQFNVINITHKTVDIELFNVIKSNEYYIVEICEKQYENDCTDSKWPQIFTIKNGQKHKIKLKKMDTEYLVRIKAYNHEDHVSSKYTMKSFTTKNHQWMKENIKKMRNFKFKIDLVYSNSLDFISIEFDNNDMDNLGKDDNNKYFVEIAKALQVDDSKSDEKELKWDEVAILNNKQTKYLVNYVVAKKQKCLFRIKSINEFDYTQYGEQIVTVRFVSEYYHPSNCREEWEHIGVEMYHPSKAYELKCCKSCGEILQPDTPSIRKSGVGIEYDTHCCYTDPDWRGGSYRKAHECCYEVLSSSGCKERYKCCKETSLSTKGCTKRFYYNCCNNQRNAKGCTQRYVCAKS